MLKLLIRGGGGSCGSGAITLRFGLSGLLLLEGISLGLELLALGLVPCAQGVGGARPAPVLGDHASCPGGSYRLSAEKMAAAFLQMIWASVQVLTANPSLSREYLLVILGSRFSPERLNTFFPPE